MMGRRPRYPQGSPLNNYDRHGRYIQPRRGFNFRRLSWRIYQLKTAAPALLVLLLLVACALLSVRGG